MKTQPKYNFSSFLIVVTALLFIAVCEPGQADAAIPPSTTDVPQSLVITVEDALKGNTNAQLILADIYFSGYQVPKNVDKALAWYELAGESGNYEAQLTAGRIYAYQLDSNYPDRYTKAVYWFKKLAKKDNIDAQIKLSTLYLEHFKNHAEAIFWLQKAAKTNLSSMYQLAKMYQDSDSPFYDPKLAFHWYEKAAIGGIGEAMYFIGHDYNIGKVVKKDYLAAYKWIKRSIVKTDLRSKSKKLKKRIRELKEIKSHLSSDQIDSAKLALHQ